MMMMRFRRQPQQQQQQHEADKDAQREQQQQQQRVPPSPLSSSSLMQDDSTSQSPPPPPPPETIVVDANANANANANTYENNNNDDDDTQLLSMLGMERMIFTAKSVMEKVVLQYKRQQQQQLQQQQHGERPSPTMTTATTSPTATTTTVTQQKKSKTASASPTSTIRSKLMTSIPLSYFEVCHGIVILTCVETGLLISGCVGTGILLQKKKNKQEKSSSSSSSGSHQKHKQQQSQQESSSSPSMSSLDSSCWSSPVAIGLTGINVGLQGGATLKDVVVFLIDQEAVNAVLSGSGSLQLCVQSNLTVGKGREYDATVGVGVGRGGGSISQPSLSSSSSRMFGRSITTRSRSRSLSPMSSHRRHGGGRHGRHGTINTSSSVAFSFTEGAFVGISLGGAVLGPRPRVNEAFYNKVGVRPNDILSDHVSFPTSTTTNNNTNGHGSTRTTYNDLLNLLNEAIFLYRSTYTQRRKHQTLAAATTTTVPKSKTDVRPKLSSVVEETSITSASTDDGTVKRGWTIGSNGGKKKAVGSSKQPLDGSMMTVCSCHEDHHVVINNNDEQRSPAGTDRALILSASDDTDANDNHIQTIHAEIPPVVQVSTWPVMSTTTTTSAGTRDPRRRRPFLSRSLLQRQQPQNPPHSQRPEIRDPSSSLYVNVDWHAYDKEQYL